MNNATSSLDVVKDMADTARKYEKIARRAARSRRGGGPSKSAVRAHANARACWVHAIAALLA